MAVQESPSLLFLNRSRLRTLRLTSTMPYSTAGALCCGSVFLASWERCSSYHWLGLEPAATSVATHISQKVENLSLLSTWQPVTGTGKKIIQLHLNTAKAPQKKKFWCVWYFYYVHICVWAHLLLWVHVEGDQSQCWKNVFLSQFSTYFLQIGYLAEPGWSLLFLLDCLASKLLWSSSPTTAKVASILVITTDVLLCPLVVSPIALSFLTCFLLLQIECVFLRNSGTILST